MLQILHWKADFFCTPFQPLHSVVFFGFFSQLFFLNVYEVHCKMSTFQPLKKSTFRKIHILDKNTGILIPKTFKGWKIQIIIQPQITLFTPLCPLLRSTQFLTNVNIVAAQEAMHFLNFVSRNFALQGDLCQNVQQRSPQHLMPF